MSTFVSLSVLIDDESRFTPRVHPRQPIANVDIDGVHGALTIQASDMSALRRLAEALTQAADLADAKFAAVS